MLYTLCNPQFLLRFVTVTNFKTLVVLSTPSVPTVMDLPLRASKPLLAESSARPPSYLVRLSAPSSSSRLLRPPSAFLCKTARQFLYRCYGRWSQLYCACLYQKHSQTSFNLDLYKKWFVKKGILTLYGFLFDRIQKKY